MEPTSWFFHETSGTNNKIEVSRIPEYVIGVHLEVRGSCFCLWAESPVAQSAGLQPCVKPIAAERGLKGRPRSHSFQTDCCSYSTPNI